MTKHNFKVGDLVTKRGSYIYRHTPPEVLKITRETKAFFFCGCSSTNPKAEESFRKSDNKWVGEYSDKAEPATEEDFKARKLWNLQHSNLTLYQSNAQFLNIEEAELIKETLIKAKARHETQKPSPENP